MWEFSTEPEYQEKLDWAREFVKTEVRDLEVLGVDRDTVLRLEEPLRQKVKDAGLWAAHLPPELGGGGLGQVKLALLHEILGQAFYASEVFGNMAPDSGNAELIAVGATDEQKDRWLYPLLEGKLRSAFSMTEPGAGADPTLLSTRAVRDGDEWVINGHKWFTSNGPSADILIVMAVTDPDAPPHQRASGPHDRDHGRTVRAPPELVDGGLRDQVRERPRARRPPHRRAGRGLPAGAKAPGAWPHPSLHAVDRHDAAGVRHDV